MKVILPARGEFGLKLRYHVPAVHAIEGPKIVYHEEGNECLYPSADQLVPVSTIPDFLRRGTHPRGDRVAVNIIREVSEEAWPDAEIIKTKPGMPEARFIPEPKEKYGIVGRDVVICPRKRTYGASKNWGYENWSIVLSLLILNRIGVMTAGAPGTSEEFAGLEATHRFPRYLDATIEAMLQAKLVIATDAGLAHLAMLCGIPLLLITYRGLVAPGPVLDPDGRAMKPAYWPVRFSEYYQAANHRNVDIIAVDAWENPSNVMDAVEWFFSDRIEVPPPHTRIVNRGGTHEDPSIPKAATL